MGLSYDERGRCCCDMLLALLDLSDDRLRLLPQIQKGIDGQIDTQLQGQDLGRDLPDVAALLALQAESVIAYAFHCKIIAQHDVHASLVLERSALCLPVPVEGGDYLLFVRLHADPGAFLDL